MKKHCSNVKNDLEEAKTTLPKRRRIEWKVKAKEVNVRERADIGSKAIGFLERPTLYKDAIVKGHDEGDWVRLANNHGYIKKTTLHHLVLVML